MQYVLLLAINSNWLQNLQSYTLLLRRPFLCTLDCRLYFIVAEIQQEEQILEHELLAAIENVIAKERQE